MNGNDWIIRSLQIVVLAWYKNNLSLNGYTLNPAIMSEEPASNIPELIKCVVVGDGAVGKIGISS